ncbi:Methyltransferase domain-containing protein [Butyrivibrio sp. ob235]|uniref:Eco57I restriction-modification methylase domain-containing protein n=1 Tax=Butyrivibrio sp. ob235 TaxID=1761780 RepID=UPI0008D22353|nr:N-6 DNA methylase [Butyrivibrio sp. ob235]SEM42685.1 Methyltransferase domain-containing protein [Butyrivibrio sp. ob235]
METLDKALRNELNTAVLNARDISENAARKAVKMLAVGDNKPYNHMSDDQRALRRTLRAHGRELGDERKTDGTQDIDILVEECAYEHWHCMLFSRFLAENNLLMHPDMKVAVTLAECDDLAKEEGFSNRWECAVSYASKMLPMIFREDSPSLRLKFSASDMQALEEIVEELDDSVFHASDSIGWCYQFWQEKRKKEINESEIKIGERELSPVTQLFTEPYMVSFLLDNSIGAWYASKLLSRDDFKNASCEKELRDKVSLPETPLNFLRFTKEKETDEWKIAAGNFDNWPPNLSDFTLLDPCCGSGHFLVAAFRMLVSIRMRLEKVSACEACDLVISQNIHGLEIDARCVEMAVFALAFAAWTFPGAGGWRSIPDFKVACCGKSIRMTKPEWTNYVKRKTNDFSSRSILMDIYEQYENAPILGSLINPRNIAKNADNSHQLDEVLDIFRNAADDTDDDDREAGLSARGITYSANLLNRRYTLVATNPPYRKLGDLHPILSDFFNARYPNSKRDIATVFISRCLELSSEGTVACVVPQNWMFLTSYKNFRIDLLNNYKFNSVVQLGENGFNSPAAAGAFTALVILSKKDRDNDNAFFAIDLTKDESPELKENHIEIDAVKLINQQMQLNNPDARITLSELDNQELFSKYAKCVVGLQTGDDPRYVFQMQEVVDRKQIWELFQNTPDTVNDADFYEGFTQILRWENGVGALVNSPTSYPTKGRDAYNKKCVALVRTRSIKPICYSGTYFHQNLAVIIPKSESDVDAMWCYCNDEEYTTNVRKIDQKLNVTNATLVKVPFSIEYWKEIAAERFPNGMPRPFTNDPRQWIFHGHPCKTIIWDDKDKKLIRGIDRVDADVVQIAVCRLLGYKWPGELDAGIEMADEQHKLVEEVKLLEKFADNDGIVCISSLGKEQSASDRLIQLLAEAYGEGWSNSVLENLLSSMNFGGRSLEDYLRNGFFKDHCKTFSNRPFIWHIWDGQRDGFSAFVNYHKLDNKLLSKLIYTVLGSWIQDQKSDLAVGVEGAQRRLDAAMALQKKLIQVLEGEEPYDIFVRWKDLKKQSIGWNPDFNDGIRLNIRPFVTAGVLRDKFNISWNKDRGKDVESSPWYSEFNGDRINDKHLTLAEKKAARGE